MNKPIIFGAVLLSLFAVASFAPMAVAQYSSNPAYNQGGGGGVTLEEQLKLARDRLAVVQANPHSGSGTPVLDAGGVFGASIIVGAVFGGIFIAFIVRAKSAKKAAR